MERHFKSIDYARGIAILMVIMVHSMQALRVFKFLSIGQIGVHIFFVVSGFSLAASINKNKDYKNYFKKRYLAIAPGYYVTMVLTIIPSIILSFVSDGNLNLGFAGNCSPLSILINTLLLHGFFPFCNNNVVGGGWYIGATVIIYLLFPLINRLFELLKKHSYLVPLAFTAIALIFKYFAGAYKEYYFLPDAEHFFVDQLVCFSLGTYLYYSVKTNKRTKNSRVYFLSGLALLVLCIVDYYHSLPVISKLFKYLFGLSVMLIMKYCIQKELESEETISNNIICKFGRNSYYIFLSHPFFCYFMIHVVVFVLKRVIGGDYETIISKEQLYIVLLPFMIVLSYLSSYIFKYLSNLVKKQIEKIIG